MSEVTLVPLRDLLADSQNGLSKRRGDSGSPVAVLRLADITRGAIDESDPREIQLTDKEVDKYALQQGDLVCIRVNGSKNLVGRVVPFRSSRTWAYCDHFIRLRPRHDLVDFRYLALFFETGLVRRYVDLNMVSSAGQNTVSQGTMLDVAVPLVPLAEQREIVEEIEKQFSRLDEAVANLQRVKANLKRYKASVLKDAVEGRLVPTEAELARRDGRSFETGEQLLQRILETRRSTWIGRGKYKEPVAQDVNELFALPAGWAAASVEQLTSLVEYGSSAKTNEDSTGVPVLRMGNIFNGELVLDNLKYLPTDHDEFPKLFVEPGDLLFNRTNSPELVGKTAVFKGAAHPFSYASYLIRLRAVDGYAPEFLAAFVNSLHGREWVKRVVTQQVGQANVNGTKLQALVVPLPPCAEQGRIISELERRLSLIRGVESEVDSNLKRAQALRQATLAKAFSA